MTWQDTQERCHLGVVLPKRGRGQWCQMLLRNKDEEEELTTGRENRLKQKIKTQPRDTEEFLLSRRSNIVPSYPRRRRNTR